MKQIKEAVQRNKCPRLEFINEFKNAIDDQYH